MTCWLIWATTPVPPRQLDCHRGQAKTENVGIGCLAPEQGKKNPAEAGLNIQAEHQEILHHLLLCHDDIRHHGHMMPTGPLG